MTEIITQINFRKTKFMNEKFSYLKIEKYRTCTFIQYLFRQVTFENLICPIYVERIYFYNCVICDLQLTFDHV